MRDGLFRRLGEWVQDRIRGEKVPEFRTREEYERWKAEQYPQPTAPPAEGAAGSIEAPPKPKQEVRQGPAICPYCGESFPSYPKRKRKCPSCGEMVIVKRSSSSGHSILMTEKKALAGDSAWNASSFVRRWTRRLEITEEDVRSQQAKLARGCTLRDALWHIMDQRNYQMLASGEGSMFFMMALFLHEEGKDSLKVMREKARTDLREIRSQSPRYNRVKVCGGACDACRALEGKLLTIEQALETLPVPCPECTNDVNASGRGWCRCWYSPHFD